MPTPTIPAGNLFMNATLYAGNSGTQTVSNGVAGQSFQPDLFWIKSRTSGSEGQMWNDTVRGLNKQLFSNNAAIEQNGVDQITAFTSTGFTTGVSGTTNGSGQNYVAWQWKAGGAAVTNTAGTISSQVSANTTSGFSVVTYTGTGSSGSVGHGLGAVPSVILIKARSSATAWRMYQANLGITKYLVLNTTAAEATASMWGSPTSTTFIIGGTTYEVNETGVTYVAYCWAPIAGYSAFGSYTGNGSADGPFVYLGFRPAFFMVKRTNSTGAWLMLDSKRIGYNPDQNHLQANTSDQEFTDIDSDFLSNGFKARGTAADLNASGSTYIYMAFAENPFKYANAR
jgi:hypothetical protein